MAETQVQPGEVKSGLASSELQTLPIVPLFIWLVNSGFIHIDDEKMKLIAVAAVVLVWAFYAASRTFLKVAASQHAKEFAIVQAQGDVLAKWLEAKSGINAPLPEEIANVSSAVAATSTPAAAQASMAATALSAVIPPAPANPPKPSL